MRKEILSNSGVLTFLHIYSLHWQENIGARSTGNNLILSKASFPLDRQTGRIHTPCKSGGQKKTVKTGTKESWSPMANRPCTLAQTQGFNL